MSDIFLLHVIPAGHPLQLLAKTLGLLSLKDLHIGSRIWVTFSNHPSTRGGPHSSHWHTTLYPLDNGHPGILFPPSPSFKWPHLSFFSHSSLYYFAYCPPPPRSCQLHQNFLCRQGTFGQQSFKMSAHHPLAGAMPGFPPKRTSGFVKSH